MIRGVFCMLFANDFLFFESSGVSMFLSFSSNTFIDLIMATLPEQHDELVFMAKLAEQAERYDGIFPLLQKNVLSTLLVIQKIHS